ncbi:MAG: sulfide/dihydroorotate dehydrogenase-like FAD/NAD-binding protein [Propionibacteriaceae bacterium]|nr:sulfide/dihydroorotate dehydrogenase-like FAD/NAD-binding protein [Propionibacteriaceae bacterium]
MSPHTAELALIARRLDADPRAFRDMFIKDGIQDVATQFSSELDKEFVERLWEILLAGGDPASTLMRFLWQLPVSKQRVWLRGVDAHLSGRYPMFAGLSQSWPAATGMGPYIRSAEERTNDFDLVNKGYIGYMEIGYSLREVELFVWLEALRDKQCSEKPCEIGKLIEGKEERKGGCPVQIHIPTMFELIGLGKFDEALAMLEDSNPLPNVTGRVCPQELQCQGVCIHKFPMSIGQVEWFLPEWDKAAHPGAALERLEDFEDPWIASTKPPVAIVGSGPAGLINAYLLARAGHPVTVFEAFHELGGVLRFGIPEFRLPNELVDDVVNMIRALGGRFVTNFVVGKTATLQDLQDAGFSRIFVGSGAGLPMFLNVPGEELLNVMSANEFLTRVNLMHANLHEYKTPLPYVEGRSVLVIGGGNTAMDAARTARRLGGKVTIVYRRTKAEMPAREEELHHALEEGIEVAELRNPIQFLGNENHFVEKAILDVMRLGEPDDSGRRRPESTGGSETMDASLVIMALGNSVNPIIRESEPRLDVTKWGTVILRKDAQETSMDGVFSGGDAARGGSTAIRAAGDGQSAAKEIMAATGLPGNRRKALKFTERAQTLPVIMEKRELTPGIVEFKVKSPAIASSAQAGQFVRVHPRDRGELIPLTLADWNAEEGWITLVVQAMGVSSIEINAMEVGDCFEGIAGPLGRPSHLEKTPEDKTVVFTAGGLGLPPVYPIMREHLRLGNHVTLVAGFRSKELMFWTGADDYVGRLEAEYGDQLEVIYTTNDGSYGIEGFVTVPLKEMLDSNHPIAKVVTIGPPMMMRGVSDLTKPFEVFTEASLNALMVDATGMCGACMVPYEEEGKLVRKHACVDGPELEAHRIDWDKFLPRFNLFKTQEMEARSRHGY